MKHWLKRIFAKNTVAPITRQLRRPSIQLRLEELEPRVVPTVQFKIGMETVNAATGTFSIPVTQTGTLTPTVTTYVPASSGLSRPNGLAFDSTGNLYVSNLVANTVSKVTPGGVVSTFATGFTSPGNIVFDAAGNLYLTNESTSPTPGNTVSRVTPSGVVSTFASGFNNPDGLAIDSAGNLYVSNFDGGSISKVTPGGVVSTFATGFTEPTGLAFDAAGNLYVDDAGSNSVDKVTSGGVVSTFATGFNNPSGLAFDAAGNLFVTNPGPILGSGTGTISEVTNGGVVSTYATGFSYPIALTSNGGNLFVANRKDNTVSEISPLTVTVPFTLGGTAVSGTDYSGVTASPLTFPAGTTTVNIKGTLIADAAANNPTIIFTLGTPTGDTLGSPAVNTLTITETASNTPAVISGLSPTASPAGVTFTETISGSNFAQGATVKFGTMTPLTPTTITATQIVVSVPALNLDESVIPLVVTNPGAAASNSVNFTVQEELVPQPDGTFSRGTADQRFVAEVFGDVLGRPVDAGGLAYFSGQLSSGVSRTQVVQSIESSQEFYDVEVQAVFQQYLHRAAESTAVTADANFLAAGNTVEQLVVAIVTDSGHEFLNGQGGGTYQGFLSAFYQDALGRAIDSGGQQFFANSTTTEAATDILMSTEYNTGVVTRDYTNILDRPADSGDQFFIDGLSMGVRDDAVIAAIASSSEYYNKTAM